VRTARAKIDSSFADSCHRVANKWVCNSVTSLPCRRFFFAKNNLTLKSNVTLTPLTTRDARSSFFLVEIPWNNCFNYFLPWLGYFRKVPHHEQGLGRKTASCASLEGDTGQSCDRRSLGHPGQKVNKKCGSTWTWNVTHVAFPLIWLYIVSTFSFRLCSTGDPTPRWKVLNGRQRQRPACHFRCHKWNRYLSSLFFY